jgi:carbonic anhydrase
MARHELSRRELLTGAGILGAGLAASRLGLAAETPEQPPRTAEDALARLRAGNRRFVEGKTRHAHESADWRKMLTVGQHPFVTLLCCSDSRVPPELVFDQGFGELFVIRVAGNVIAADVLGSIQYAVRHLATPLLVVMGHEECGAVTAAVESLDGKGREPKYIEALVKLIEPGLAQLPRNLNKKARINAAVEANVRWSMKQLAELPEGSWALEKKVITLAGAVYELGTGSVRFLR